MINSFDIPPMPTFIEGMTADWDTVFAETYAAEGSKYGLHIEHDAFIDSYRPFGTECHAYAFVMSIREYEEMLAAVNADARQNWQYNVNHASPYEIIKPFIPLDVIPWNAMLELPGMAWGKTRQEALIKARENHLNHELIQRTLSPHAVKGLAHTALI